MQIPIGQILGQYSLLVLTPCTNHVNSHTFVFLLIEWPSQSRIYQALQVGLRFSQILPLPYYWNIERFPQTLFIRVPNATPLGGCKSYTFHCQPTWIHFKVKLLYKISIKSCGLLYKVTVILWLPFCYHSYIKTLK